MGALGEISRPSLPVAERCDRRAECDQEGDCEGADHDSAGVARVVQQPDHEVLERAPPIDLPQILEVSSEAGAPLVDHRSGRSGRARQDRRDIFLYT